MIKLRPYQQRAQTELLDWFAKNLTGNPIVDACVGSGKSLLIADLCKMVLTTWPEQRIIMVVASRELVKQNYERLLAIWPEAPIGIHSAGLRRKDIFDKIIFASIGSVYSKAMHVGRFDIALIDECHNINTKNTGMYRQFINEMLKINPAFRVIGYTGTPYRGNGTWLHKGEDALFTDICTRVTIRELLDEGYLAPLLLAKTSTIIDASNVKLTGGDYNLKELSKAADKDEITVAVVDEIIANGHNRDSWVIYCVDIKHTEHVMAEVESRGIKCAMISGKTAAGERDKILNDFKHKRIKCVLNCMVLTVGWDNPATDLIALLRNTKSPVLYIQIAGRGLRTHPDKQDCLWLDFTNTTADMGPVDAITGRDPVKRKKEGSEAPIKICINPDCKEPNPAGVRFCVKCDTEFPIGTPIINGESSMAAVLTSIKVPPKKVTIIKYYAHQKLGSEDISLRVEYLCGMQVFKEWVPIQNRSMYARSKAQVWWSVRSNEPVPRTVEDALTIITTTQFREAQAIETKKDGRYDSIVKYHF